MIPRFAPLYLNASHYSAAKSMLSYAPVANNREGDPTDDLNTNKQGVQIKAGEGGGSGKCSRSKVATRYQIVGVPNNYL